MTSNIKANHKETESLDNIQTILKKSREAFDVWSTFSVNERVKRLKPLNSLILQQTDRLCSSLVEHTGKVATDALLAELIPVLELNSFYQKHAHAILKSRPAFCSPFVFPFSTARIDRRPWGVVAIITPWNYPFQLTLSAIISALYSGNSVIFKISELTGPVELLILNLMASLDLPGHLVQAVSGDGAIGEQLIAVHPDFVFFTGSLTTGKTVMQLASQHPIPVLLELGGKDAMLVLEDANLNRVVQAALYGSMVNSGQVCMSTERLYVESTCYDRLLECLLASLNQITANDTLNSDLGRLMTENQFRKISRQYHQAIQMGASASGPLNWDGQYLQPLILWNVTHEMEIMQEETFGPVLAIMSVRNAEEMIQLANDCSYGLNASIWSRNTGKAQNIANRLNVGNWVINDVLKNGGHPGLPFGGTRKSGFGRYRGEEGLLSFSYPVSGMTNFSTLDSEPNWFPYNQARYQLFKEHLNFLYGKEAFLIRCLRHSSSLFALRKYATPNLKQLWHNFKYYFSWNRKY